MKLIKLVISLLIISSFSVIQSQEQCKLLREQCIEQLKKDKLEIIRKQKEVDAFVELINKDKEAVVKFFTDKDSDSEFVISQRLVYKNGLYHGYIEGKIRRYDIKYNEQSKEYVVYEVAPIEVNQKTVFDFQPALSQPRPFDYFSSIFKFGGVLNYDGSDKEFYTDIALMYEFLSFDKLLGNYGWSLNASLGLNHTGVLFGYQFIRSSYFKNTSLVAGYSYNFRYKFHSPTIGIALNF